MIELLIVIAIILILISIALPNFLEAQMRAKVVKTKGEIRSLALSMEQYYLDWKLYPAENEDDTRGVQRSSQGLFWLSSPIKYMSKIPTDPFGMKDDGKGVERYYEMGGMQNSKPPCYSCLVTWAIFTRGPDMEEDQVRSEAPHFLMYDDCVDSYSPTNGSRSVGDIFQFGGDSRWIGVPAKLGTLNPYKCGVSPLVVDWEPYLHRLPPKLR